MADAGNLLEKVTDPMVIIIRVVGLMAGCFWFLWEFLKFLYFLECPSKIIGGLHMETSKKPSVSNSKIRY